jgi:hypothetical protein
VKMLMIGSCSYGSRRYGAHRRRAIVGTVR